MTTSTPGTTRAITKYELAALIAQEASEMRKAYKALGPKDISIESASRFTNSATRMKYVLKLRKDKGMSQDAWFALLGQFWCLCDSIHEHEDALCLYLETSRPLTTMMTPVERFALRHLPEVITVYRGCSGLLEGGMSWSLDREVALKFATTYRPRPRCPVLVTALVSKDQVLALRLGRGEKTILTFKARIVHTEHLAV